MATVASVATEPSPTGREIHRLTIFDGRLYPAYGDYGSNTGPIDVVSLDLDTQTLGASELIAATEETWTQRVIAGRLFLPYMDPRGADQLAVAATAGSWTVIDTIDPMPDHLFGVAETSDGLWLHGALGTAAVIWRSTDDGATWTTALTVAGGELARFYACAQFGDDLIALYYDGSTALAYRWASGESAWSEITSPGQMTDALCAFTHDGTAFWLGAGTGKDVGLVNTNTPVVLVQPADSGMAGAIAASLPNAEIYDACTDGTWLYLLGADGQVWRGDNAGSWSSLLTLDDSSCRSIAVDPVGGVLYFGDTAGNIKSTPIPA